MSAFDEKSRSQESLILYYLRSVVEEIEDLNYKPIFQRMSQNKLVSQIALFLTHFRHNLSAEDMFVGVSNDHIRAEMKEQRNIMRGDLFLHTFIIPFFLSIHTIFSHFLYLSFFPSFFVSLFLSFLSSFFVVSWTRLR